MVLAQHSVSADFRLERWDLLGEAWRDTAAESTGDAAPDPHAVHDRQQEQDRQQSLATGFAAWQVRVELPSQRDVRALAQRLKTEGWPVRQRRNYLVAGANCEDDASDLAEEIAGCGWAGAGIRVERAPVFDRTQLSTIFLPIPPSG